MVSNRVDGVGASLRQQHDGRYALVVWHRLVGGRMHQDEVVDLAWTELCDCLLTMIDGLRPGWEAGDGWRQPDLAAALGELEL